MALEYNGKLFLNLQEQVEKNKNDIATILYTDKILSDYGIRVVGKVNVASELPDPAAYLEQGGIYGDAFAVNANPPYDFYIFTRAFEGELEPQWLDVGQLAIPGPQGEPGAKGETGPEGKSSRWYSGNTTPANTVGYNDGDQYINISNGNVYSYNASGWTLLGNIKGPKGDQGQQGVKGQDGTTGPQGPRGPQGVPAFAVTIIGELEQPPTEEFYPITSETRHDAYIYQNELYVILEDEEGVLMWTPVGYGQPGSRIFSNGVYQSSYDIDLKLNKTNGSNQVYGTNALGTQTTLGYSSDYNVGSSLIQRDANGRATIATPTSNYHITNKLYVDNNFVAKNEDNSIIYATDDVGMQIGIAYSKTPGNGSIPVYNNNGCIATNNPVAATDAVNKAYFDTTLGNIDVALQNVINIQNQYIGG